MAQVEIMSLAPCPLGPEYLDNFQDEMPISSMNNMGEIAEYPEDGMNTLLPCIVCNRTFNPVALERHRKVCESLSAKKRNVFDSTKKRISELESPRGSPSREAAPPKLKSRWREKRAEFLRAIRAAKHTSDDSEEEGDRRNSIPSDYIQCPSCARHFGPKSADRHIDWCREQKTRLPKNLTQEDTVAVTRMRTRVKYTPPRPGHSGWKAPKKKDVISSIPPQNSGANITPAGRLVTPPLPNYRQISPPPMSPSRKASSSSLPPGPPRYGTSSLGRAAGKQFSTMLQAVTGSPTGYGLSSGYGSSSVYGTSLPANSGYSHTPFQRTSSLRIPRKKYGIGQKMARHRDLASDMLASVMGGGKRLEPEGDEAGSPTRSYERNSHRLEDKPYDPFSAAELQFQSLLAPTKGQRRKPSGLMGSTGSLKHVGLANSSSERDFGFPGYYPKPRSTSLSVGQNALSLLGLNSYGIPIAVVDYADKDSAGNSPTELTSPDDNLDILSHLSSSKSPNLSPNRSPYGLSPTRSPSRFSPSRSSPNRIISHHREKSPYKYSTVQSLEPFNELILSLEETAGSRKPADGAHLNKLSPPAQKTYSKKKSLGESNSLINRPLENKLYEFNGNSTNFGWIDTPEYDGQKTFSRYFGRDNLKDRTSADGMHSSMPSAAYDSLKAIRESFSDNHKKKDDMRFDDQQRLSSGSSTDSSFPPVSSPLSSSSPSDKNHVMSQITRFCHECEHKYPVDLAKFCCQCGVRRINV